MKTLLIAGIFCNESNNLPVLYDVTMFGQSDKSPAMQYITHKKLSLPSGYNALITECKEIYCSYFNVDNYNIITLTELIDVKDYTKWII